MTRSLLALTTVLTFTTPSMAGNAALDWSGTFPAKCGQPARTIFGTFTWDLEQPRISVQPSAGTALWQVSVARLYVDGVATTTGPATGLRISNDLRGTAGLYDHANLQTADALSLPASGGQTIDNATFVLMSNDASTLTTAHTEALPVPGSVFERFATPAKISLALGPGCNMQASSLTWTTRLGDLGVHPEQGVGLTTGWAAYGGAYGEITASVDGHTVVVEGLAKNVGNGQWGHIGTLPVGMRPSGRLIFHLDRHGAGARVDVLPDGKIVWRLGGTIGWQSLAGISFPTNPTPLPLAPGFNAYGKGFGNPGYQLEGGQVRLTGLVSGTTSPGALIATLPAGSRPTQDQEFLVNQHEVHAVLSVARNGEVRFVRGNASRGWVSLDGIAFPVSASSMGTLSPSAPSTYVPGKSEPLLAYDLDRVQFTLSGCVTRGNGTLMQLPPMARPREQLIFHRHTDTGEARIDLTTAGAVVWNTGPGAMVCLDGITWLAK